MSQVAKTWDICPQTGNLALEMSVKVNGLDYRVRRLIDDRTMCNGVPPAYVARALQRDLMAGIEKQLSGGRL